MNHDKLTDAILYDVLLILCYYLVFQGGSYGMKFNIGEGGFHAPYGDGYGAHMVCLGTNLKLLFHNFKMFILKFIIFVELINKCYF